MNILVCGGGGFIGGHLAKKLYEEGHYVVVADIKRHEYFQNYCDVFLKVDLSDSYQVQWLFKSQRFFDVVYQLATDMGGAGYIFSGENDANVMHNSALINLNIAKACLEYGVGKVFYSSSACMYPEYNQLDPENPNCEESSAYPANPDSEYGWEKLFSERLYMSFARNYGLNVRIARFHNIYGPQGTWTGGKEKSPAAICRKVIECEEGGEIEIWGDGKQTRSFLYVDSCLDKVDMLMNSNYDKPVNIGSEEMISINDLAKMAIKISGKDIKIKNLYGQEFIDKYGYKCPLGVKGRNSNNNLFKEKVGEDVFEPLEEGIKKLYNWIEIQNENK